MPIALQDATVYGPIHSRRLGVSLGINLLPVSWKLCDFDCVYCQYGWTPRGGHPAEPVKRLPAILAEIREGFEHFHAQGLKPDVVTLAGNGEPAIHPDFCELTAPLMVLAREFFPGARVGILTDSSTVVRQDVRRALTCLDDRFMKLDVGSSEAFERVNKPIRKLDFQAMLDGLRALGDKVVQSLFIKGSVSNCSSEDVSDWIRAVRYVAPKSVQVYSIDRDPADPGLVKLTAEELEAIARRLKRETAIPAEVFD